MISLAPMTRAPDSNAGAYTRDISTAERGADVVERLSQLNVVDLRQVVSCDPIWRTSVAHHYIAQRSLIHVFGLASLEVSSRTGRMGKTCTVWTWCGRCGGIQAPVTPQLRCSPEGPGSSRSIMHPHPQSLECGAMKMERRPFCHGTAPEDHSEPPSRYAIFESSLRSALSTHCQSRCPGSTVNVV